MYTSTYIICPLCLPIARAVCVAAVFFVFCLTVKVSSETSYVRMYWIDIHQIFGIGSHMGADELTFVSDHSRAVSYTHLTLPTILRV